MTAPPLPPAPEIAAASPQERLHRAIADHQAGRLAEAEALYRAVLNTHPDNFHAHHNLGVLVIQRGLGAVAALPHFRAAWTADPAHPQYGLSYLRALVLAGDVDEARRVHADGTRRSLALPSIDVLQAEAEFRGIVAVRPDLADAHCGLGRALSAQGRIDEAMASFRRALAIEPEQPEAYAAIGALLIRQNRWVDAEAHCRDALTRNPSRIEAYSDLGAILERQGRLDEAAANYRRALALAPDHLESRSGLLFALHYAGRESPEVLFAEAKAYGARARARASRPYEAWQCAPAPGRLRVGIVSGDLRLHPVGYFLEQVLAHSDRDRIEWVAYPSVPETDELSARLQRSLSGWNSLVGLTDEDAARRMHADGIHVLVDLSGHTRHNRLPVFAWRPAPVQISWLGYFATTGLAEMDHVLADRVGLPSHLASQFTETIWYLPDARMCFAPPETAPAPARPPALENGFVTFGCLQAHAKITDETLHTWSRILSSCPGSRLRLQNESLSEPGVVAALNGRLVAQGIDPARVEVHSFVPRTEYLAAYAEIDIALDTFPYPGGTTTCEALWMGVPTLTLAGESMIARQGASLLTAAGLADWVTASRDEYVAHAIARALDLPRLAALRKELRERVRASPLYDAPRFAKHLDDAICAMWTSRSRHR